MITIIDALQDKNLFGGIECFKDLTTWRRWITFLKATYGLPLDDGEVETFKQHTGRSEYTPPAGGWGEVACIVGRQSGKTRVASILAAYEAAITKPDPGGGELYALLVAQDHRAAQRALFSYVNAALGASDVLKNSVVGSLRDSITLKSGLRVAAYPCRPASVRGLRARVAICDELAFFCNSEQYPVDLEMLRALRPTLATTGGKLISISSPYGQAGALWEIHRRHYGRDDAPILVWQATAPEMNPTLDAGYLERMKQDDPDGYRAEVLGEFRAGLATLFDPDVLDEAVVPGQRELPPTDGIEYHAFVDPSGGREDAFTLAIGHLDEDGAVVDALRAWKAPFNPSGVTEEAAVLLRQYRLNLVIGDRYAGEWPREQFRGRGIRYGVADKPKSDLYLSLLAAVNSDRVELPDDPALLRELRGLERRRGSSGRDRVDHRPGSHDDRANAVAGLIDLLLRRAQPRPKPRAMSFGPRGSKTWT